MLLVKLDQLRLLERLQEDLLDLLLEGDNKGDDLKYDLIKREEEDQAINEHRVLAFGCAPVEVFPVHHEHVQYALKHSADREEY